MIRRSRRLGTHRINTGPVSVSIGRTLFLVIERWKEVVQIRTRPGIPRLAVIKGDEVGNAGVQFHDLRRTAANHLMRVKMDIIVAALQGSQRESKISKRKRTTVAVKSVQELRQRRSSSRAAGKSSVI